MMSGAWTYEPGLSYTLLAIYDNSKYLVSATGIGLSVLIAIGLATRVIKPFREKGVESRWAAAAAWILSVWAFHCVVPSGLDGRYLLPAVPALLMFLAAGFAWVAHRLPLSRIPTPAKVQVLAVVAALVFVIENFVTVTFPVPMQVNYGFTGAVQAILSKPEFRNSVLLISTDSVGEGIFIAEMAQRERRPGHFILRSSKVLAKSAWSGGGYRLLYRTTEEVMRYLDEVPVGIVVVGDWLYQSKFESRQHYDQLNEVIKSHPQHWELLGSYPRRFAQAAGEIKLYRRIDHENRPVNRIRVDMSFTLDETLEKAPMTNGK